ncbi:MAG: tetratricopeptide repeat protein, partial [Planctomycetes bacterium]|nr:tetratricopeptide repeat protein [Planctomycetota bacterium]
LGVVRRCLLAPNLAGRCTASRATWSAAAIATLWACHPLGVDAVAYVTQRTTLLMSACLLVGLYAVLRAAPAPRPRRWQGLAVLAMALGMASKEEFVAAPVLVVLFERAFLLPDWRAVRARLPFHLGLAASWGVLAVCLALGPHNETVGYDSFVKVSAFEWLMTQAGVILHYLRLVGWPHPLRGIYDQGIVRDFGTAALPLLAVGALFVAAVWQWRRRPWLAWSWAMFFLLLGPTSSVMPIVTEVVAERRMYLPMLAVVVPGVLLVVAAVERLLAGTGRARLRIVTLSLLGTCVAVAYVLTARAHTATFASAEAFWADAMAKNDLDNGSLTTSIVLGGYADTMRQQGRNDEALRLLQRALQCPITMAVAPLKYGELLRDLGRLEDSEKSMRWVVQRYPGFAEGLGQLAFLLIKRHEVALGSGEVGPSDPRLAEAVQLAQRAYELAPAAGYLNTLGMALCRQERLADAERVLRRARELDPEFTDAISTLGAVLCFAGRLPEGIALWLEVLERTPRNVGLRLAIANAQVKADQPEAAAAMLDEVLRLEPGHPQAQAMLRDLRAGAPR